MTPRTVWLAPGSSALSIDQPDGAVARLAWAELGDVVAIGSPAEDGSIASVADLSATEIVIGVS